jgi:hypothetical protein
MEANVILPAEGFPVSAEAVREWFRRTHGHEASEIELGELLEALAQRESQQIEVGEGPQRE